MPEPQTRAELEKALGPRTEFILNRTNSQWLRRWAIAVGKPSHEVYSMSNVELSNFYQEYCEPEISELQRVANDMFVKILHTVQSSKVDPYLIRDIVLNEIAKLPAKQINIVFPNHVITINGPVHQLTETILRVATINHPIMLVGPAGCGKTTIGRHISQALNFPFYITSTINDEHQLTGFVDGYGKYHRTAFRDAFELGGVWVADEIDAWDAGALLAANAALANGYSVFPDSPAPIDRHPNFRMVATANTFGHGADRVYIGRNELDAASLDRFATITVDYDPHLEREFSNGNTDWLEYVWSIRRHVIEKKIRHVVSSRAIMMGSVALAAGITRDQVEEFYLFKGMSEKDREKIKTAIDDNIPF